MHKALDEVLNGFIARDGIIAAALIGTDGLIIDSASCTDIDMDRFSALFGIYFANTASHSQDIRILPLPKQEKTNYVLLANVSGALLALFTNNILTENSQQQFLHNIDEVQLALSQTH